MAGTPVAPFRVGSDQRNPVRYGQPKDRHSRIRQWNDAVETLLDRLDAYHAWPGRMQVGLAGIELAERLDAVLDLREAFEQLAAAELPSGFGRA